MSNPLLQLTLTIDEASIGKLLQAALMLHARIDALGLIEHVPYTKNVPAQLKHLGVDQKKLGRPLKGQSAPIDEDKVRRNHARQAFIDAVAAAGSEGLEYEAGKKAYAAAGGNAQGYGPMARNMAQKKRDRLFPKG